MCATASFRTYNWVVDDSHEQRFHSGQHQAREEDQEGQKNSNIVPPNKLVNHLLPVCRCTTPSDDWRAALNDRTARKFDVDAARVERARQYETTKQYGRQLQSIFNLKTTETGLLQRVQNNEISARRTRNRHPPGVLAFKMGARRSPTGSPCHNFHGRHVGCAEQAVPQLQSFTVTYTEVQTRSAASQWYEPHSLLLHHAPRLTHPFSAPDRLLQLQNLWKALEDVKFVRLRTFVRHYP